MNAGDASLLLSFLEMLLKFVYEFPQGFRGTGHSASVSHITDLLKTAFIVPIVSEVAGGTR